MHTFLFELLRVYAGVQDCLSRALTAGEWQLLYDTAKAQAVIGLAFDAVKKLPKSQTPPDNIFWSWMTVAAPLRNHNAMLNDRTAELEQRLRQDGFLKLCILKGQGNSTFYPDPLARQGGDIDVWADGGKDRIIQYAKQMASQTGIHHHLDHDIHDEYDEHVDLDIFPDAIVELHFHLGPANMKPVKERLTAWFSEKLKDDFRTVTLPNGKPITVPTLEMNFVHQVAHFHHHVFQTGLKQLLDFYYLLQSIEPKYWDDIGIASTLRRVRLYRVAKGMLYVLKEVMGLKEDRMPFAPSGHYGRFFLREILRGGNFGWYSSDTASPTKFQQLKAHLRYLPYFPMVTMRYIYGCLRGNV